MVVNLPGVGENMRVISAAPRALSVAGTAAGGHSAQQPSLRQTIYQNKGGAFLHTTPLPVPFEDPPRHPRTRYAGLLHHR